MLNKIIIIMTIVTSFVVIAFFTTSGDNASTALIATKDHSATTDEVKNLNSKLFKWYYNKKHANTELTKQQLENLDIDTKAKVEKLNNQVESIESSNNSTDNENDFPGIEEGAYAPDSQYGDSGYDQYGYDEDRHNKDSTGFGGYDKWENYYGDPDEAIENPEQTGNSGDGFNFYDGSLKKVA